jgi:hypothetical protein
MSRTQTAATFGWCLLEGDVIQVVCLQRARISNYIHTSTNANYKISSEQNYQNKPKSMQQGVRRKISLIKIRYNFLVIGYTFLFGVQIRSSKTCAIENTI